jgi:penicillin-binding protein 1A
VKLEREYSKDEILEFYLNTIYWGRGAYGIQAAARTYFDIDASELSLNQSATLAGMIASPSNLDPAENHRTGRRSPAGRSHRHARAGLDRPGGPRRCGRRRCPRGHRPHRRRARPQRLLPRRGPPRAVRVDEFDEGELFRGLHIHTQLSPRMQRIAQSVLANAVADGPTDTGSIVTVDPRTGGVLALVGGPDIDTQQLNAAVVSPRQPGSTFKAFTLQAFTEAGYSPESTLPAPAELEVDTQGSDEYTVNNYGGSPTASRPSTRRR